MNEHCNDNEILAGLAQASDHPDFVRAIRCLYERCFPFVRDLILKNSGSVADAEDTFQEVLIVLMELASKGKLHLERTPCVWLLRVAKYQWLHVLRRPTGWGMFQAWLLNVFGGSEKPEEEKLTADEDRALLLLALDACLSKIGERCRHIIKDFYIEELSMADIARIHKLGGEQVARQTKYRCMERLKDCFFSKTGK